MDKTIMSESATQGGHNNTCWRGCWSSYCSVRTSYLRESAELNWTELTVPSSEHVHNEFTSDSVQFISVAVMWTDLWLWHRLTLTANFDETETYTEADCAPVKGAILCSIRRQTYDTWQKRSKEALYVQVIQPACNHITESTSCVDHQCHRDTELINEMSLYVGF